jgi:ABC-type sulfate transport system permease component
MRAGRLLIQLTAYYVIIALLIVIALKMWPDLRGYLPVGGVEQLISEPAKNPLQASEAIRAEHVGNFGESLFWLSVAIVGALICSLPVSWVYMTVRSGGEYDQSLVNTIILLPMALAFSLAGIAGAVRFRNSLKSSGDALFILLAVSIGLSAGIGAIELAAVVTAAMNYAFTFLWMAEYGERKGMKRYLADYDGLDEAAPPEPDKKK